MDEVEVVVAHNERAVLRIGDVFLKVDADLAGQAREAEAMALAPIPTPRILWRQPHVLALEALPGAPLGRLGDPSPASAAAAWRATGVALRLLHDTPLPALASRQVDHDKGDLDAECDLLVANGILPADLVARNRTIAEATTRRFTPVFIHGDLQVAHVFVEGDDVVGVIDWSEAGLGDPVHDLATLTLGNEARLGDVLTGYGGDVSVDVIRGWWARRSLLAIRWLIEHGFDPFRSGCEVDVLRSAL